MFNKLHQKDSLWRKTAIEKEKKDDDEDKKKQATSNEPSLLAKIFCCGVTNRDKDNCDKPEQNEEEIEEKILQRVMQAKEKPDEAGYDDNFDFINANAPETIAVENDVPFQFDEYKLSKPLSGS